MRGLFLTGTDTGVGKTTVGRALLRLALRRGRRLVPYKPAETGCANEDTPEPADAVALWHAAGRPVPSRLVCLYPLAPPVAPAAAAAAAGLVITLEAVLERAAHLASHGDGLVVEGAGGLLVPYAPGLTAADLAAALSLPLLVVARDALGTVNHTALTVAEVRRRGLPLLGVVLVATSARHSPDQASNAALIGELAGVRLLGTLPFVPRSTDDDALADALESAVDVGRIWAGCS